jgi:3-methyladenine DNA glycosylase AlkD
MSTRRPSPESIAAEIRHLLRDGGSAEHADGVQWFFNDEIKSHGWYTAKLRTVAVRFRRRIRKEFGLDFLLRVADKLFVGRVRLFESWLPRISSWADHDGLVHYLIAPMVAAKPDRTRRVSRWAKSTDRWHRRAACVALIQGTRREMFFSEIKRLSDLLLSDEDAMVQKGLGWLLRETAKADAKRTVPYLISIRERAPRLVLRTACETLPTGVRKKILAKPA